MRFPGAATEPKEPLRNTVVPSIIDRLLGEAPSQPQPLSNEQDDLPAALDERVRLIGEW